MNGADLVPIQSSCPTCSRSCNPGEELVGKRVKCKGCGATFVVSDAGDEHNGDDRPSGGKSRAGLPGWVWAAITVAGLVGMILLSVQVIVAMRGAPVTEETYARIPVGMPAADVKKLLGEPHETSGGDTNHPNRGGVMDTWAWKSEDNKIYVFLMEAKVVAKKGQFGTKVVEERVR